MSAAPSARMPETNSGALPVIGSRSSASASNLITQTIPVARGPVHGGRIDVEGQPAIRTLALEPRRESAAPGDLPARSRATLGGRRSADSSPDPALAKGSRRGRESPGLPAVPGPESDTIRPLTETRGCPGVRSTRWPRARTISPPAWGSSCTRKSNTVASKSSDSDVSGADSAGTATSAAAVRGDQRCRTGQESGTPACATSISVANTLAVNSEARARVVGNPRRFNSPS